MLKKILTSVALLMALVCAFASCGGGNDGGKPEHTHAFGEWETVKSATCTEKGSKIRYCSCGENQTAEIQTLAHSFGEWTVSKPATTTEKGIEERVCECGEKETRDIEKISVITTVTKEEWKEAFEFSKFASFTMDISYKFNFTNAQGGKVGNFTDTGDYIYKYNSSYNLIEGNEFTNEDGAEEIYYFDVNDLSERSEEYLLYPLDPIEDCLFPDIFKILMDKDHLAYKKFTYNESNKNYTANLIGYQDREYKVSVWFEDGYITKMEMYTEGSSSNYGDWSKEETVIVSNINSTPEIQKPTDMASEALDLAKSKIQNIDSVYCSEYEDSYTPDEIEDELIQLISNLSMKEIKRIEKNIVSYEDDEAENSTELYIRLNSGYINVFEDLVVYDHLSIRIKDGKISSLNISSEEVYISFSVGYGE